MSEPRRTPRTDTVTDRWEQECLILVNKQLDVLCQKGVSLLATLHALKAVELIHEAVTEDVPR